jgi:CarD family transcriptional regulator
LTEGRSFGSIFFAVKKGASNAERTYMSKKKQDFSPNEFVVYPAHGVGKIVNIETQEVAGFELEMFVVAFEKDKMTLRVPTHKATEVGMRPLSTPDLVAQAFKTLKGKARVKRAMWSRRAQEYEQKINSGDLIAIAEVVRDLHRHGDQREQSYSERQLYEAALERLTREIAVVQGNDEPSAQKEIDDVLVSRAAAA